MGYVAELRALVGRRPLILVGAAVIVQDEAGRLLLQRRADTAKWSLPGGALELGETVEDAARREVREETAVVIGRLRLLGVASGADLVSHLPNGDQVHNVSVVFTVEDWEGLPTPDGKETLEARFFHASALPHDLNPPDRAILARFGPGG